MWIDDVCINLTDMEEKGHQIAFMDQIRTSRRTLIHLGYDANDIPSCPSSGVPD